jgi:SAM-dependent methyltransferase
MIASPEAPYGRRTLPLRPPQLIMRFRLPTAAPPLPLPPAEMRVLVGRTADEEFDNPDRRPVVDDVDPKYYRSVLDFGCGCGRLARQMIQQRPRPKRYAGLDLHPGMIKWCQENLAPRAPGFSFHHHDVSYGAFNPGPEKPLFAPFPFPDREFTLVVAVSVFTHLTEEQTRDYLAEVARVLHPEGIFVSTWFLFDKGEFPMMQEEQNTLFINPVDVRNAVIYDRGWLVQRATDAGLAIFGVKPPSIRGFQWWLRMTPTRAGVSAIELPEDLAPRGRHAPPAMPADSDRIGLG